MRGINLGFAVLGFSLAVINIFEGNYVLAVVNLAFGAWSLWDFAYE